MTQTCCPSESWPMALTKDNEHDNLGKIETLDNNLDIYHVGSGKKAIIVIYDVFGLDNGRNKSICDNLAKELNCRVIIPDFYRNRDGLHNYGGIPFTADGMNWVKSFPIDKVLKDCEVVIDFLKQMAVDKIFSLGFCWGGWVGFHLSATGLIDAAASCHASIKVESLFGNSIEDLSKSVKTPILLCQAGNDEENTKKGGDIEKWVKEEAKMDIDIFEFSEMKHGWVPRGDESVKEVKRDVALALDEVKKFFIKHQ